MTQVVLNGVGQKVPTVTNGKIDLDIFSEVCVMLGDTPIGGLLELQKSVNEAKAAWEKAMFAMKRTESDVEATLCLNEKPKLYALDAIAVSKVLGISKSKRIKAAKLFSLYYLAVHLFDDAVEDREKLAKKFTKCGQPTSSDDVAAVIASFALNLDLCFVKILSKEDPEKVARFLKAANSSLSKQFRYFLLEKNSNMTADEVLEAKQHLVSGESTAFFVECLKVVGVELGKKETCIRNAMYWLGSLTQFMDDLRDLNEDRENGNLNLILAIENENNSSKVLTTLVQMYLDEEEKMVACLKKAGVKDPEVFKAVPWHPFYMKHLV